MSKTIYRLPEPDNETPANRVIYNFITAAQLVGVMEKCKDCKHLKEACDTMHEAERMILNDNKMD